MLDYRFYSDEYGGTAIPGREWPEFERDADAQLRRYERIYTVSYETDDARPMVTFDGANITIGTPFSGDTSHWESTIPYQIFGIKGTEIK